MKILKHGTKNKSYRFNCPSCDCCFLVEESELREIEKATTLLIPFQVQCPDCSTPIPLYYGIRETEEG